MAYNPVTELDFDLIKDDLKEYMRSQPEFSDFDFEGAGLNIMLDILAKNTHLNAYMANMLANEMFLDSGEVRQSVVSKAKELGYTPRSVRSSEAVVDVTLANVQNVTPEGGGAAEPPAYVEMEAGTQFSGTGGMIFSTYEPILLYPTGTIGQYKVEDISIYDGRFVEFQYVVDFGAPDQKFTIQSENADTTTLTVAVKPTEASSDKVIYELNEDINVLNSESTVYFLHETAEGNFEVTFGDGIIGKALENGNVVLLGYIIAENKADANGIESFQPVQQINGQGGSDIDISSKVKSYNGAEKEGIAEIKFNSTRFFQSQKRAVTTNDYETFVTREYPFIESINTWGGEYNDPPQYGKVFIAIKPRHTEFLSPTLKETIKTDLIEKFNVVTVIPELVDPDYLYVGVSTSAYYIKSKTVKTEAQLIGELTQVIYNYFLDTTRKFKMDFLFSPMTQAVDATDKSINSSLSDITLHKRVFPILNLTQTFSMKFNNALQPGTLFSTFYNTENEEVAGATIKTGIKDDGNGVLYTFNTITGNVIKSDVGTVDYTTGEISFTIHTYGLPPDTEDLRMYATPVLENITPGNNQIIVPDTSAENGDYMRLQGISVKMILTNTEVA